MLTFKVGDKAVYPSHGVGVVQGIEQQEIAGKKQQFYVLRMLEKNDMTIKVPVDNAKKRLRKIIPNNEVERVFAKLKDRESVSSDHHQTWNRRYRIYKEKIDSGELLQIAEVLRDLSLLKFDKDLSFSERKMLDQARTLLTKELAIAKSMDEEEVEEELDSIFS
ncbi:MAG TPA: CarD family transcriptional regulator [bacterium]|nr:CarD family transcriptional regulator [bacterium]